MAQISNKLSDLIDKGTRKKKREVNLAELKRMRELRFKMIQRAKSEVVFNFARILSFNRLQGYDLTRATLLSLIPTEYTDYWLAYDFSLVKSMPGAIKNLLGFFKEYFGDYFKPTAKTEEPE